MGTETETAWAAGLFDGEGCFSVNRRGDGVWCQASLSMTDFPTVERFLAAVGVGALSIQRGKGGNRDLLTWSAGSVSSVERTLNLLKPWLGARRARQGELAVQESLRDKRERRAAKDAHCGNGHRRTDANTYHYTRDGKPRRACRICARERRCRTT